MSEACHKVSPPWPPRDNAIGQTYVVDETILGGIVLGLQCAEKRLLGAENLDSTCGVLREVKQAAGVADQPRADEVANKSSEVWCDRVHTVPEVFGKLYAIRGDGNDLVT